MKIAKNLEDNQMKRTLFTIMLFVLGLGLMGCKSEPQQTPKGWALQYAEEQYEEDYGGYGLFAVHIEQYGIYGIEDLEDEFGDYQFSCYEITFINDSGKSVIYNVFIAYEQTAFQMYFGAIGIRESQIYDIDIEENT